MKNINCRFASSETCNFRWVQEALALAPVKRGLALLRSKKV